MKKRFVFTSLFTALVATSTIAVPKPVGAYAAGSSISLSSITTINLNDLSDSEIRNYYSSLNDLSASELSGTNLLKNLKPILVNNFTYLSYDAVSNSMAITERNWERSKAEDMPGYNASTNTVSGYKFDKNYDDPYLKLLYRNDNDTHDVKMSNKNTDTNLFGVDKEHIWCQSKGFKASSGASGPAGTDLHHLIAADHYTNSSLHNNLCYGIVKTETKHGTGTFNVENKVGYMDGYTSKIFEPRDEDKGDIARACFYMLARYNNYANTTGAISKFEPFLNLIDSPDIVEGKGDTVTSSDTTPAEYASLSVLYKWHKDDPVDDFEIHRNNLIYNNFQHDRNPFIDFPIWVDAIYGEQCGDLDSNYVVNPQTDAIYTFPTETDPADDVELNVHTLNLKVGESSTISVKAGVVTNWVSSDTNVVTVDNKGKVTAVSIGTATITASDDKSSDTCTVTVVEAPAPEPTPSDGFDIMQFIEDNIVVVGIVAAVVLIFIIIVLVASKSKNKKTRKAAKSVIKTAKKVGKKASKSKKK